MPAGGGGCRRDPIEVRDARACSIGLRPLAPSRSVPPAGAAESVTAAATPAHKTS